MQIKEVAQVTGISSYNIRFYEKMGLITPIRNPENDYREYTQSDINKLNQIRLLRSLGLSINTIRNISNDIDTATSEINTQILAIDKKIEILQSIKELCKSIVQKGFSFDPTMIKSHLQKIEVLERDGTLFWDMLTSEIGNMIDNLTVDSKQTYSIFFNIDHISDDDARCKIVSTNFWNMLIKKFSELANEFEIRCWDDEIKGIAIAEKYGAIIPNDNTKEIVFRGQINKTFIKELLEHSLSTSGVMLWFTVNLYNSENLLFSSSHWGSEIVLPNIDVDNIDIIIKLSKGYSEVIDVNVFENQIL